MTRYVVVFDVTKAGYHDYWFPAFGLIFVAYAMGELLCRRYFPGIFRKPFRRLTLILPVAWVSITFAATFYDYARLSSRLREGKCEVAEGVVQAFHPARNEKDEESFVVNGQFFNYSSHVPTAGFSRTVAEGSPIRTGLQVCIRHLKGEIAELEVAE